MANTKKPKIPAGELLKIVRQSGAEQNFRLSRHAGERCKERGVDIFDIANVLSKGRHNPASDEYKEAFKSWNYSFVGAFVEGGSLEVIIAIEQGVLIVTVINLEDSRGY